MNKKVVFRAATLSLAVSVIVGVSAWWLNLDLGVAEMVVIALVSTPNIVAASIASID